MFQWYDGRMMTIDKDTMILIIVSLSYSISIILVLTRIMEILYF